ncbi:uncharacterized protein LOC111708130 [Eurytemora carolleeae]|uniref:uncharacterized protein LOC111708130 n=1 Tax=Eurytemora carolleeae TaxID=1294199 RepID=UPI000C7642F9|nr:uncharacterized protein LOC111708130 [Eurytemora carolleeae]|eukprot:XP_023337171.1 uncharacterized protein LOC111708130 [Eurytemora affinis]
MYGSKDTFLQFANTYIDTSALKQPAFYFSKERVAAYYVGWIVQKDSKWLKPLDHHILLCDQAGFNVKIRRFLQVDRTANDGSEMEKMNVEHVAVGFFILGIGYVVSALGMNI